MRQWVEKQLFRPIDIASLAVFRVMFGLLMAYDSARYVAYGWVQSHYIDPPILLRYIGFQWVEPLPLWGMNAVYGVMVAAALCISLGLYYRLSCLLFFLGHTYGFLLAAAHYLNHAYLISVFTLLMAFVPAHRALSLDAVRTPGLYTRRIPAWPLWLLCGLLFIVFVFGGIAKLNADWFAGEPIRHWLQDRTVDSVFGSALGSEPVVWFVVWSGAFYDLLVGPALLWNKTRLFALAASIFFHLSNAYLFSIGIFPWFMLAATTLFLDPSWPRKLPVYGKDFNKQLDRMGAPPKGESLEPALDISPERRKMLLGSLSAFFVVMLVLPLRHHIYPGDVAWTEEGHYLSWRMKLRHKEGVIYFVLTDPASGATWRVDPAEQLTERQTHKMVGRPDLILQYAHYLRDAYKRERGIDVEVRADVFVSLNYRERQRFISPDVDLAKVEPSLMPYTWIEPYKKTPLPSQVPKIERVLHVAARRIELAANGPVKVGVGRFPQILPPAPIEAAEAE
jgi:hypothetical protein